MNQFTQFQQVLAERDYLKRENEYLKKLVMQLMQPAAVFLDTKEEIITNQSRPEDKIRLFRSLFKGRNDVYALRWESRNGRSGYTPACAHEWDPQVCKKTEIKCSACKHRSLLPLTDQTIYQHSGFIPTPKRRNNILPCC